MKRLITDNNIKNLSKKNLVKGLSFILTTTMIFGLMPMAVSAKETPVHELLIESELPIDHGTISVNIGGKGNWENFEHFTSDNITPSGVVRYVHEGERIVVAFDPDPGYVIYSGYARYPVNGGWVYLDKGFVWYGQIGTSFDFEVPYGLNSDYLEIGASFKYEPYEVIINESAHGTVTTEFIRNGDSRTYGVRFPQDHAAFVDTVKINAVPDEGYELTSLKVLRHGLSYEPITVTNNQFEMPDSYVTIEAVFTEIA